MENYILYLIMLFSFYGYALFVAFKYGVQTSLSQSWYAVLKWLHSIAIVGYLVPGLILGNSVWAFVTACALGIVC